MIIIMIIIINTNTDINSNTNNDINNNNNGKYMHILAPVKILYMWLVAIVIVIAFGGGPIAFQGFCGNQHIRDPTWSQNPILNRLGNASRSCYVTFRCFGNNSCSFHFACMFLNVSFICVHIPFILHSFPVIFLPFYFDVPFICINVLHFPWIYGFRIHSNVDSCPFIFLSSSFQFACMFLSFCIHIA